MFIRSRFLRAAGKPREETPHASHATFCLRLVLAKGNLKPKRFSIHNMVKRSSNTSSSLAPENKGPKTMRAKHKNRAKPSGHIRIYHFYRRDALQNLQGISGFIIIIKKGSP